MGILVANNNFPPNNLTEMIEWTRRNPGKGAWATSGIGSSWHINSEMAKKLGKFDMLHTPFQGFGPMFPAILNGQIPVGMFAYTSIYPMITSGKVKLLGISSEKRNARLPEVPAIAESYPGHVADTWNGLMAPAKTPSTVIDRISRELQKAMGEPAFVERIEKMGLDPVRHTPQEFAESIRVQVNTWREVIRKAGIKPE